MSSGVTSVAPSRSRGASERDSMRKRFVFALIAAVVASTSFVFAYALLFSQFMPWDDEGYFLLGLRAYRDGGGLYERIRTIYGPFYFEAVTGVFGLLRAPLDNVGARWFVACAWIAASLCVQRCVQRITKSRAAGWLAYALSFPILIALGNEPLHPGGLIVVLLASLVLVCSRTTSSARHATAFAIAGALTAAIALTKLNVGAFTVLAFLLFFARSAPIGRVGSVLRVASAIVAPLVPPLLMMPLLARDEFRGFALFVALALVPFGFLPRIENGHARSRAIAFTLGGLACTAVVLAVCVAGGTSIASLGRSLVIDSSRFVGAYVYPPLSESSAMLAALALAPLVLGALVRWTSWFGSTSRTLLRGAAGFAMLALSLFPPELPMLALPLVWVVAARESSRTEAGARTILAALVVFHALHAFPVAGSQVAFFSFLVPAVGAIAVWDAFSDLPESWRERFRRASWRAVATLAVVAIVFVSSGAVAIAPRLWKQYDAQVPLELSGAESIRLPERRVAALQWVTANLAHNSDTFVGVPGMHSFYGWTALEPPVAFYPHTWMLFSDEARQREIADALLATKRPCIVRNRSAIEFWSAGRAPSRGPISDVAQTFRVAGAVGGYELLFPPAASIDLVLTCTPADAPREMLERHGAASAMRLAFPAMPGVRIARIVAVDVQSGAELFDSSAASADRRATILAIEGGDRVRGEPLALVDLAHRTDVLVLCPPTMSRASSRTIVVRAFDERGRVVARLSIPERG
jgi:hypothetical protein